jgi:hypothetical protein
MMLGIKSHTRWCAKHPRFMLLGLMLINDDVQPSTLV